MSTNAAIAEDPEIVLVLVVVLDLARRTLNGDQRLKVSRQGAKLQRKQKTKQKITKATKTG